jgi:transcriptional regulator with XRE-family HTH domain
MNIKIGAIIKKLRAENHITQETLATAIGVTPQAISRWEAEGGYPDLELLPALADFFAVSTDELLGYKLSEREQELADIKKEMERLDEVGSVEECLAFARNAFARYPNDYEIRLNLGTYLHNTWDRTHDERLLDEIESLYQSVVNECDDEDIRDNAIGSLIILYKDTRRSEKAKALLGRLTPLKYCREETMAMGIGDGNTELYIQDEIDKLTDGLGLAIRNLALNEDLPNDPSTWDKKIEMLREAEGHAESIRMHKEAEAEGIIKIQQAEANAIAMLKKAGLTNDDIIRLKSFDALKVASNGKATKVIIPSDIQNLTSLVAGVKESAINNDATV